MGVPFFVAFSGILLLGRYLPFMLPPTARAVLAPSAAGPAPTARCAVSVAVAGLALLVMSTQCGSSGGQRRQCPAEVAMEGRALWFNSAALFLGMVLGGVAVVRPPPYAGASPIVPVAVEHPTWFMETVAVTAFAHDVCVFFKVVEMT